MFASHNTQLSIVLTPNDALNVPEGQRKQAVPPALQNPGEHVVHVLGLVPPAIELPSPAGQAVQNSDPLAIEYVPGGHSAHGAPYDEKDPIGHIAHVPTGWPSTCAKPLSVTSARMFGCEAP